jgi:hypothetical protein
MDDGSLQKQKLRRDVYGVVVHFAVRMVVLHKEKNRRCKYRISSAYGITKRGEDTLRL